MVIIKFCVVVTRSSTTMHSKHNQMGQTGNVCNHVCLIGIENMMMSSPCMCMHASEISFSLTKHFTTECMHMHTMYLVLRRSPA